jgi:hypothetical protein
MSDGPRRLLLASALSTLGLLALAYLGPRWRLVVALVGFLLGWTAL